ncbi:hypothetical protein BC829DRAFT_415159 [Chytridium lagenaria]|nr:hypothetical protein BC829DRAFT_415159 [Chytridium lagenaria]
MHPQAAELPDGMTLEQYESMTPLEWAAWNGNVEICKMILDKLYGAERQMGEMDRRSPFAIMVSALAGRPDRGADVNAGIDTEKRGEEPKHHRFRYLPPLFQAVKGGSVETCETLLSLGADIQATYHGRSILSFAASHDGTAQTLEWVLSHYNKT